jgi:hypothetical protein
VAKFGESRDLDRCSFCGKSQKQVGKLIAGPSVYICNECIALCNEIIDEEGVVTYEGPYTVRPSETTARVAPDSRVFETCRRLEERLGRRPTMAELAADLDLDELQITDILRRTAGEGVTESGGAWTRPSPEPDSVDLRAVQRQLAELAERLKVLVNEAEHRDGL